MASTREINTRKALVAVLAAIEPYTKGDATGRPWLTEAHEALAAYKPPTPEEQSYIDAAFEQYDSDDIDVDANDDVPPVVSIGEDNGAFVQAWVWVRNEDSEE